MIIDRNNIDIPGEGVTVKFAIIDGNAESSRQDHRIIAGVSVGDASDSCFVVRYWTGAG